MRRSAVWLLALVLLAPAAAVRGAGPTIEHACFNDAGIRWLEDPALDDLVRAREESGSYVIVTNPERLSISTLSPTTLEYLFQRECQLGALGYLAKLARGKMTEGMHHRADCQALRALRQDRFPNAYAANRAVRTIERDLKSLAGDDWPDSMGPRRIIDFKVCK